MTLKELCENKELFDACGKEIEEKVRGGQDAEQAKAEVLKAHGVEVDEDALKARKVEKMPVSDEELEGVSGGVSWCWGDHACAYALHHDGTGTDACFWSVNCYLAADCDLDGFWGA